MKNVLDIKAQEHVEECKILDITSIKNHKILGI